MDKEALDALFDKYIRKLRITPEWDIKLELVEDPTWNRQLKSWQSAFYWSLGITKNSHLEGAKKANRSMNCMMA